MAERQRWWNLVMYVWDVTIIGHLFAFICDEPENWEDVACAPITRI